MAFEPFDLGKVMMTAEAIKNMRRDSEYDKLRQAYIGEQITGAQQQRQQQAQEFDQNNQARIARMNYLAAQAVENSPDPVAAARELAPEMVSAFEQQHGAGTFARLPPEVVKQIAAMGKEKAAAQAGLNLQPSPDVRAQQQFAREMDQTNFGQQKQLAGIQHGYRMDELSAANSMRPGRSIRAMTEQEVAAAGLPPGTAAQVDENTGKIDVLSKRDNTNTMSQKDATTAKMKLNTVKLARQQLARIRDEFEGKSDPLTNKRSGGIKGTMSAGPAWTIQGHLPTEGGAKFDAAVNQMRSTLTALTRVPGVGAMSDYETKLDQAKFPTRKDYESVTQQQIDDLDNMLNAIETGYTDLLSGGAQTPAQPGGTQPTGGWSVRKVK